MESSREKMIGYLERAAATELREIIFFDNRVLPPLEYNSYQHPLPRIVMPLSGEKRVLISLNGKLTPLRLAPGMVLFGHDGSWLKEFWDVEHEMVSLVYFKEMIRVLYISHRGIPPDQNGPDAFYHTAAPISAPGNHMVKALMLMSEAENRSGAPELVRALLRFSLEEVCNDREPLKGKALFTWNGIVNYLQENWARELARDEVAEQFKIHPSHLSRLARRFSGMGFNAYVTQEKMEHAARLLVRENLTVDEVAVRCGYNYTSYFIRVFEKHFHASPNSYRGLHGS